MAGAKEFTFFILTHTVKLSPGKNTLIYAPKVVPVCTYQPRILSISLILTNLVGKKYFLFAFFGWK